MLRRKLRQIIRYIKIQGMKYRTRQRVQDALPIFQKYIVKKKRTIKTPFLKNKSFNKSTMLQEV